MIDRRRLLLIIRLVGFVASLLSFRAGAYGLASMVFNARHNPTAYNFWDISYPRAQEEAVASLLLLISLYLMLDGRLVLRAILRGVPTGCPHACPACGYDLTGETSPGCSECGWGRERARKTGDPA